MQSVPIASATPPAPFLPAHPEWVAAYWQAWRGGLEFVAAADGLAQVRALRASGLHDEAFVVACEFMDRAAAALYPVEDNTLQTSGRWPALATLLVEEVVGVTWSRRHVHWELRLEPSTGLHGLALGRSVISLTAEADTGAGVVVAVDATAPFDLTIRTQFTTFHERAPAGQTRYLLTYLDRTDILTGES